jgi:hypothetical protein
VNIHLPPSHGSMPRQRGALAVEFALVGLFIFFPLIVMLIDAGRVLFVYNTMQEVTRSAAREATIRWIDKGDAIKKIALMGGDFAPGAPEISKDKIEIAYLNAINDDPISTLPSSPGDNMSACADALRANQCIDRIRVKLSGVKYALLYNIVGLPLIDLPESTVILHAESLGFND